MAKNIKEVGKKNIIIFFLLLSLKIKEENKTKKKEKKIMAFRKKLYVHYLFLLNFHSFFHFLLNSQLS